MRIDIEHIAQLANLPITDEEKKLFQKQLSSILIYFARLSKVKTEDGTSTGPLASSKHPREDETRPSLPLTAVLSNGAKTDRNFIIAKGVFNG